MYFKMQKQEVQFCLSISQVMYINARVFSLEYQVISKQFIPETLKYKLSIF